jgi:hypothetical protein
VLVMEKIVKPVRTIAPVKPPVNRAVDTVVGMVFVRPENHRFVASTVKTPLFLSKL